MKDKKVWKTTDELLVVYSVYKRENDYQDDADPECEVGPKA